MRNKLNNNKGLTLIEVLASIVLLSIVIISFMSLFPQMTLMNHKTEDNLQAANVGKELLVEIKKLTFESIKNGDSLPITNISIDINSNLTIIDGTYKSFKVKISLYANLDISGEIQKLHRIRIEVLDDKSTVLTSTYGYMEHN
ncbi:type II secretion system protein [Psychrobacillus sp. INOP01]|uniref:type IV pilus modification PilV family protein n=1 Tax=Psychrobacillus sp. INOP01 TaxID=2829187 RepID=UPI001BACB1B4|nr:prepilin-type N-terminal cleavage/methylation domain-containing protein [Psychrobacillus sp. INOP01]QUG42244.1 type II secretion system protein [Psychrobacillus sp. INOP01]